MSTTALELTMTSFEKRCMMADGILSPYAQAEVKAESPNAVSSSGKRKSPESPLGE
jgi:hypothetical protein